MELYLANTSFSPFRAKSRMGFRAARRRPQPPNLGPHSRSSDSRLKHLIIHVRIDQLVLSSYHSVAKVAYSKIGGGLAPSSSGFPKHPLAEVFGFPYNNLSSEAARHRKNRLCPFHNKVPSCTKDKANDPLGVCSIFDNRSGNLAVVCPVRFRQDWIIVDDAASFFFEEDARWTTLTEIRLNDDKGKSAGNIDIVLVSYDTEGRVVDFGALEIQAVYISGNMRIPFERYMVDPPKNRNMDWTGETGYPRPDYLSSSRKRLVPQLLYKGRILHAWHRKSAVAIHSAFYETLPTMPTVPRERADIAWLIYDISLDSDTNSYRLVSNDVVYTEFDPALTKITTSSAGAVEEFVAVLQQKLDAQLDGHPPNAPTLLEDGEE